MIYGYCRVSTAAQASEGTLLDSQKKALTEAGAERIFTDAGVSGAKASRPALDEMLDHLREGDTVIVAKLDRMGRSLAHLIALVALFKERGVIFKSLSEGIDSSTPAGRLMLEESSGRWRSSSATASRNARASGERRYKRRAGRADAPESSTRRWQRRPCGFKRARG